MKLFCFTGNGRESGLLFGNKWELDYSLRFPKSGMGMGTKTWEWEGMGTQQSFPHISNVDIVVIAVFRCLFSSSLCTTIMCFSGIYLQKVIQKIQQTGLTSYKFTTSEH